MEGTKRYFDFFSKECTAEQRIALKEHHPSLKDAATKADADHKKNDES